MADKIITEKGAVDLKVIARTLGTSQQTITASTIEASADWQGLMIVFAQACTVTIPSSLPADFSCGWMQSGDGIITFQPAAGETLLSFQDARTSAGQNAIGGIGGLGKSKHLLYGQIQ